MTAKLTANPGQYHVNVLSLNDRIDVHIVLVQYGRVIQRLKNRLL